MSNSTEKNKNLMRNASFLMVATLISRVVGLLYRSPLRSVLGGTGMGYYSFASDVYVILLLISAYSIPMAIAKVVSDRLALKQYRNAHTVFKGALLYAVIVGGVAALAAIFAGQFLLASNQQNALLTLQILGPTIFLSAILGVLRGYFQAHNNMMPTAISQVIEQVANAVISIVAAILFIKTFAVEGDEISEAIYGSAGGALGTGAGVLVGLIFMVFVYLINKSTIDRQVASDRSGDDESLKYAMRIIILMVTPVIFSSFIYSSHTYIDGYLFTVLMGRGGMEGTAIASLYGEFSGSYSPLINIPLALSSATSSAMLPEVAGLYARKDTDAIQDKIHTSIRLTMFIVIPAAVGLSVLAFPIMHILFPTSADVAGYLLMFGGVSVVFAALSTITNGVLQAIGKPKIPLKNAAISLGLNIITIVAALWFSDALGVYAVLLATVVFSISMCVLNQLALKKYLDFKNEYSNTYIKPLLAAIGMGVVAWLAYYSLHLVLPIKIICLGVAVVLGVGTYLILYVVISKPTEEELRRFPFGSYAVKFMKMIRIYR